MIRKILLSSFAGLSFMTGLASPAAAEQANLLGAFKNWTAYSTGAAGSMTCYAMSQPRASQPKSTPKGLKRGSAYLMVSDWQGRKTKGEPEIVPGYQYRDGAIVTLGIGPDKFNFFARNDNKLGTAWLQNLNDSGHLLDAMSRGVSAVAIGTSARGTKTVDTYSLAGFPEAVAKIHAVCNL